MQYNQVSPVYPCLFSKVAQVANIANLRKKTLVHQIPWFLQGMPYIVQLYPSPPKIILQHNKNSKTTLGCPQPPSIYNPNTIIIYSKTSNTTTHVGWCVHPYKKYYNIAVGLLMDYFALQDT